MPKLAPPPVLDPVANQGLVTTPWLEWFSHVTDTLEKAPRRINTVALTDQAASIAATDLSGGNTEVGLYRLSYYARITTAATTSSSLTVTLGWTDGAVSLTQAGAAMTGNTTTTTQSGSVVFLADVNSSITYATTYASAGATAMEYKLSLYLELLP